MISANFMPYINARTHWETLLRRGRNAPGWRPTGPNGDSAAAILVAETDAQAQAYLQTPDNSVLVVL